MYDNTTKEGIELAIPGSAVKFYWYRDRCFASFILIERATLLGTDQIQAVKMTNLKSIKQ